MNSPVEERLRQALSEAGAVIDPETLRPLRAGSTVRRRRADMRWIGVSWARVRLLIPRASRRWVTVASVVVAAGVMTGVMVTSPSEGTLSTAAAVLPPNSDMADLSVFLCHGKNPALPSCEGEAITKEQRLAVQRALRNAPWVATLVFEDQRQAFKNFQADDLISESVKKAVRVGDMPESFRVKISPGADHQSLIAEVKAMPGVAQVVDSSMLRRKETAGLPEGWPQERTISVFMCRRGGPSALCEGKPSELGNGATPEQVKAAHDALRSLPEVADSFVETREMAWKAQQSIGATTGQTLEDMNESIRLLLHPDADHARVIKVIESLSGVDRVVEYPCPASTSC
ncbi:permease-like cell division protein FtsX [Nonomuraea endophytica]|uniref:permease-like cell division protein FtsX n=1 Tax=Nonomuraea endophytica TaxID=714136 RepID=UPI0037C5BAE6